MRNVEREPQKEGNNMRHTIPYTHITENIDDVLSQLIDRAEGALQQAEELDVITDDEVSTIEDIIEMLENIRGVIND